MDSCPGFKGTIRVFLKEQSTNKRQVVDFAISDKKKNGYLLWGNGFPILGEVYFSADGLTYIDYDSKLGKIEVANILVKGATIQDVPLEEDLYVSWTYDFKNLEIQDLVQVNADGETQDFIHFTEEEWEELSNGYKESLLNIAQ